MGLHARSSSCHFCCIFLNLSTKIMDLWISKSPAVFLRTNIGKWKRFFRKIKAIFYVLKQTNFAELSITLAPICSNFAHAQSFFSSVGLTMTITWPWAEKWLHICEDWTIWRQSDGEFSEACLFQNIENGFYSSQKTLPFPNICSQKNSRTLWNSQVHYFRRWI